MYTPAFGNVMFNRLSVTLVWLTSMNQFLFDDQTATIIFATNNARMI